MRESVRLATLGSAESEAKCGPSARSLMGYWKGDKRYLTEVDGDCKRKSNPFEVTGQTTWGLYQDWDTTSDGVVVWTTAWPRDPKSSKPKFNQYGTKKKIRTMTRLASPVATEIFGHTDGATNEAQISTYWP